MTQTTLLITGACGYLGAHLIRALAQHPQAPSLCQQRRPLLHVRDAARALIWAWQREASTAEVFNLVAENPTIESIAQQLAEHHPSTRLHYTDQDYREQLSLSIDGAAARAAGFSPQAPWPEALLELLGHFRGLG